MTDCTCPECCEWRAARDEDLACAQMFDYASSLLLRRKDWEHATTRFRKAIHARNTIHERPMSAFPSGHPATNRTEQQ